MSVRKAIAALVCAAAFAAILVARNAGPSEVPQPAAGGGVKFVVHPYLQFATRTSIVILCETDVPTTCVVEYGATFPPDNTAESATSGTLHEVKLDNLQPRSKYFYRVTCTDAAGRKLVSEPFTFSTAIDATDAYSFAVIGDTQKNPMVTANVAKQMFARRPNFVLHMGDVVDNGPDPKEWVHELFGPCRDLFARVPVYPCIGNHEKNHAHYYKYFALPKPEYYYSFKYGNAEFFVLDTNKVIDTGTEQYVWLDRALAASDAKWKFCYHHHPCYSSDSDDYGNTWKGHSKYTDPKAKALIPLYEKHKVDVALNGHIHLYERTWPIREGKVDPKGVVYLTSGGGGGRLEDFDPVPAFFKNQGRVVYHYCYFTIHNGLLEGKAFDDEGRLFDSFALKKE